MLTIQDETVAWIALLAEILIDLPVEWRHAVLKRTRLHDPAFIGQVLQAIHMTSLSLRNSTPMPTLYTVR